MREKIQGSKFLVIGGGGSIGRSVSKQIFMRGARTLHVVDLNENTLVELVRSIRSDFGYETKDFDTFALDCGDPNFGKFFEENNYDYVLNLSAMKHVRNENSLYTMLRMVKTNITNAISIYDLASKNGCKKYFCVSTDKAANPANFMGATKRVMEYAVMGSNAGCEVSMARFANVAFSDGSLLDGFQNRIASGQPLTAPRDIKRFFITEDEAGIMCLLSTLYAKSRQIAVPINKSEMRLTEFTSILTRFLEAYGYTAKYCQTEEEARMICKTDKIQSAWPVYVFESDTTERNCTRSFTLQMKK